MFTLIIVNYRYVFRGIGVVLLSIGVIAALWPRGFVHFFGIDTQQSDNYDFFSGPGPVFVTILLGSGALFTLWSHLNCHVDGCPRIGKFPLAGGQYKVCRQHLPEGHPAHPAKGELTAELIHRHHHEHEQGRHDAPAP